MANKKVKISNEENKKGVYGIVSLATAGMGVLFVPLLFGSIATIFGAVGMYRKEKFSLAGLIIGIVVFLIGFFNLANVMY